jgi:hypothetical protein
MITLVKCWPVHAQDAPIVGKPLSTTDLNGNVIPILNWLPRKGVVVAAPQPTPCGQTT